MDRVGSIFSSLQKDDPRYLRIMASFRHKSGGSYSSQESSRYGGYGLGGGYRPSGGIHSGVPNTSHAAYARAVNNGSLDPDHLADYDTYRKPPGAISLEILAEYSSLDPRENMHDLISHAKQVSISFVGIFLVPSLPSN